MSQFESFSAGAEARHGQPGRSWRPDEQHRQEALIRYLGAVAAQAHALNAAETADVPTGAVPLSTTAPVMASPEGAASAVRVRDVMTTAAVSVQGDLPFREVARVLSRGGLGAVPVTDEDGRVVGVVSESDLLAKAAVTATPLSRWGRLREHRLQDKGRGETAAQLMTSPAVTVHAGTPVAEAALTASRSRLKRLPVVDHNDRLEGMVSRGDLLAALVRDDESIRTDVEQRILRHGLHLEPNVVHVRVDNGVVTLDGQVTPAVRERLVEAVGGMADVARIVDHLAAA